MLCPVAGRALRGRGWEPCRGASQQQRQRRGRGGSRPQQQQQHGVKYVAVAGEYYPLSTIQPLATAGDSLAFFPPATSVVCLLEAGAANHNIIYKYLHIIYTVTNTISTALSQYLENIYTMVLINL